MDKVKVAVVSGAAQKTYTVHKHVLVKSSKYFQTECNKDWKEARTKTINLTETRSVLF